mgnify:CR=1 FL=1
MPHNYGMRSAKQRTSFALDEATVERLHVLARRWGVSQAEVVRRAVREASERVEKREGSVAERLQRYRAEGRIVERDADRYLQQIQADRSDWFERNDSA